MVLLGMRALLENILLKIIQELFMFYASEFRYRNAIIDRNTVLLAISQSGETADTNILLLLKRQKVMVHCV